MAKGIRKIKMVHVSGRWQHKASRYALSSLTSGKGVATSDVAVKKAARDLTRTWRERLKGLRRAGWSKIIDGGGYVYAANCPPVGVIIDQTDLRSCQNPQVCPWCWCRRYVLNAWDRFDQLLFPPDKKGEILPLDLIEICTDRIHPVSDGDVESALRWIKDH
jgi:hypothetical protein